VVSGDPVVDSETSVMDERAATGRTRAIPGKDDWKRMVRPYERPRVSASLSQLATSVVAYVATCAAMYLLLPRSAVAALLLAPLAAAFLLRTFVVFHDCGHMSFFRSRRANELVGQVCALLVFTPFTQWRHEHAIHHASSGDLDRRGTGDVTTLTIREYLALDRRARLRYRLYRNPFVMFGFGGLYVHIAEQRFWKKDARPRDRSSVLRTNVSLALAIGILWWLVGPVAIVAVQLSIVAIAGPIGIWLFYVQHQFEDAYWADSDSWSYAHAALRGSSYLRLPRVLQWCTGNIGFHHIHHLSSRVPNYNVQRCHDENPALQAVPTLTLGQALRTVRLKLWDEDRQRLVGWRHLRELQRAGELDRPASPYLRGESLGA
jgi:omega-6 fatty acid desaturase (delta-12 desaturase)